MTEPISNRVALERSIALWRKEFWQTKNRDPTAAELTPNMRAQMLELRVLRAQTQQDDRTTRLAAGGKENLTVTEGTAAAHVQSDSLQQLDDDCCSSMVSASGASDEPFRASQAEIGDLEEPEEVTSDNEYFVEPKLYAPCQQSPSEGTQPATQEKRFTRAPLARAEIVKKQLCSKSKSSVNYSQQSCPPTSCQDVILTSGRQIWDVNEGKLLTGDGAQGQQVLKENLRDASKSILGKRPRLSGPAFIGKQPILPQVQSYQNQGGTLASQSAAASSPIRKSVSEQGKAELPAIVRKSPQAALLARSAALGDGVRTESISDLSLDHATERAPLAVNSSCHPAACNNKSFDNAERPSKANAILTRTAEGLNVLQVKREALPLERGNTSRKSCPNAGWGNNFVRYDMKKGKGSSSYKASRHSSKRRRMQGRSFGRGTTRLRQAGDGSNFLEGWKDSKTRCFKCGGAGHWAKDCTIQQEAMVVEASSEEEGEQKAHKLAALGLQTTQAHQPGAGTEPSVELRPSQQAEHQHQGAASGSKYNTTSTTGTGTPLCSAVPEGYTDIAAEPSEAGLLCVLEEVFGFGAFRGLQLPTIQRLLKCESILSIMPTGMGKSLCYQLPSLLLPGITLVISPLIALMHDQRASLPPQLSSAVLWSGQSKAEALQTLADVKAGLVKVLFISPERLSNPHLQAALQPHMPLPLVVVDEAHCVAEWGHSFRPAYFRLGNILQNNVQSERVLALTATATKATEAAILSVLGIKPSSVLRDSVVRDNLRLHVVRKIEGTSSHDDWGKIVQLFVNGQLQRVQSAIVYCAFKDDADKMAQRLNAHGVRAAAYHAGRQLRDRAAVEADFTAGRVRVVVATVAFGMGINIQTVEAVIHATMPRSLEEYVQQIGRAGRNGLEAKCYAYLSDADFAKLRSLAFSAALEMQTVQDFLDIVFEQQDEQFGRTKQKQNENSKPKQQSNSSSPSMIAAATVSALAAADDISFPGSTPVHVLGDEKQRMRQFKVLGTQKLGCQLDMKEDCMETILSYLEAQKALKIYPSTALVLKVSFYAATAAELARTHLVIQVLLQACPKSRRGVHSAQLGTLANLAQQPPGILLQEFRVLAATNAIAFELSKDEGPAYEVLQKPKNITQLAQQLHKRLISVLCCQVRRLDTSFRAFAAAAELFDRQQQQEKVLRQAIASYFEEPEPLQGESVTSATQGPGILPPTWQAVPPRIQSNGRFNDTSGNDQISSQSSAYGESLGQHLAVIDVHGLPLKAGNSTLLHAARAVLNRNAEHKASALAALPLARILHGLGSPAFPGSVCRKLVGSFWGSQMALDFGVVLRAAEIACRDHI